MAVRAAGLGARLARLAAALAVVVLGLSILRATVGGIGEGAALARNAALVAPATASHCLYFSFATLTTVGFGDFVAAADLGHTLSVLEALLGQIYLVTVVSLIVSNLGRPAQARR
jgi:Ion channel